MAPHFSTLAWKIPWTEEPGRLQSMGSPRVGHDWATSLSLFTFMHWRRKWQPAPVFLPGESQGRWSLMGCCLWGRTESDTTEVTAAAAYSLSLSFFICEMEIIASTQLTSGLLYVFWVIFFFVNQALQTNQKVYENIQKVMALKNYPTWRGNIHGAQFNFQRNWGQLLITFGLTT